MSENKSAIFEMAASSPFIATKFTYTAIAGGFFGYLMQVDVIAWCGIVIALLTAIIVTSVLMMGCVQSTALVILANLKQPCPELQILESGQAKDVLPVMIDDQRKYVECSNKVDAWIRLTGH